MKYYPNWVSRIANPEQSRHINGHYYLYAVSSYYDPGAKRTEENRSLRTEADGFVASEERRLKKGSQNVDLNKIAVRMWVYRLLVRKQRTETKEFFRNTTNDIYIAYARLHSPINRMPLVIGKSRVGRKSKLPAKGVLHSPRLGETGQLASICRFIKSGNIAD